MKDEKLIKIVSLRLSNEMYDEIKEYCYQNRITMSELVRLFFERIKNNK